MPLAVGGPGGLRGRSEYQVVLTGDIGGTNTRLAFLQVESQRLHLVSEAVFPSRNYPESRST